MNPPHGLEGTVIAQRYELVSLLGAGSFASVWRAKQLDGAGEVAVKILSSQYTTDPELVDDFINDGKNFVAFRDEPNVATILDCGHDLDTGLNYVAMTLLESTIDQVVSQTGPLPVERLYRLASDMGQALRAIHGAGLVHRDIKATNVMTVPGDDRFILSDYGVGIVEDSAERTAPTMDMSRNGIWAYASPEKIQGTKRSDQGPASDFYSLGVVLYKAATGQFPFTSTFPQIINDHLKKDPPDPQGLRPDLPTPLASIILRCLQKTPERRFLSPTELIDATQAAQTRPEAPVALPGKAGSKKLWYVLGGVLGVLALAAIVWALLPKGRTLELATSPPGAAYRLYAGEFESRFDAVELGETPEKITGLKPGSYTIAFEKDGYFSEETRIDISDNDLAMEVVVLHPMHEIRVDSDPPGAEASLRQLNGQRQEYEGGRTPVDFKQLRSGPHELILRLDNFATQVETLFVRRNTKSIARSLVPGELRVLEMFTDPPGAEVFVTGVSGENWEESDPDQRLTQRQRVIELTPCRVPNLKSGQYQLEFTLEGYVSRDTLVTVLDSIPATTVVLALQRDPSLPKEEMPVEWPRKDDLAAAETAQASETKTPAPKPRPPKKPAALTPAQLAAAQTSIRRTLVKYEEALEARTIRGFSRLWISMPSSERTKFERSFADIVSQQLQISEKSLDIEGNRATLRFHELRVVQPAAGREIRADRDRVMSLQRLGSGEWLISDLR